MKKFPALLSIALILAGTSCNYNHGKSDLELTYTDSDHTYSMDARFNKSQMKRVENYLSDKIGAASNMSFTNLQSDAMLTLDDHTTFYMKKFPGHLQIRLNKDDNSDASYRRIKEACEGLKTVLTKQNS